MQGRLAKLIDFDRLNGGGVRISIAVTDVESGEPCIFDSTREKISMDHISRQLRFNAPFEPILENDHSNGLLLYVIDLYARDSERPRSLEAPLERKSDLMFGNQAIVRLRHLLEIRRLRAQLSRPAGDRPNDTVLPLSYRPGAEEPGPEKSFVYPSPLWPNDRRQAVSTWKAPNRNDGMRMVWP
jgi:NTE family protein